MSDISAWTNIWKINGNALRAAFGFAGGWLFWQGGQIEGLELFLFFAALFALGGAIRAVHALIGTIRLILGARKWARYRRQGVTPKADRLAIEDDLKRRGLIK
ncbi:MAG: hypothetical protein AAGC79_09200 [Pseudomonadota bacterium]